MSNSQAFFQGSFEEGLAKAADLGLPVLIDFFTTWCGPCKMLDETTWQDPSVVSFLKNEVVALKLDAEREAQLAARFRIEAYPTIVLLSFDGKEMDRLVGYHEPSGFLSDIRMAIAGKDSIERARSKITGENANNPMLRFGLARELLQKQRFEEAFEELIWCYDEGAKHDEAFAGVRLSYLTGALSELGAAYPPARKALIDRRDDARAAVMTTISEPLVVAEYAALNEALGEQADTLAMFDSVRGRDGLPQDYRAHLFDSVFPQLLEARRYEDILEEAGDLTEKVESALQMVGSLPDEMKDNEMMRDAVAQFAAMGLARYYQALLGANRHAEAAQMAETIKGLNRGAVGYAALVEAAHKARAAFTRDQLLREAAEELSNEEFQNIRQIVESD